MDMKSSNIQIDSSNNIKVLGNGELNKKVNVTASAFSSSATKKIEKKGGTVTVQ